MYQQYGHTPAQIAGNIATDPLRLFADIFSKKNQSYLMDLFGPHVIPAVFSPQVLLLGLPIFLQNLLSSTWTNHTIYFHYAATLVPFILLATVNTFDWVRHRVKPATFLVLTGLLLVAGIGHTVSQGERLVRRVASWGNPIKFSYDRLVNQVGKDEPVVASFVLLSHLTDRPELYSFHYVIQGVNTLNGAPFALPAWVRTALLDFDEPDLYARFSRDPVTIARRINREFFQNGWMLDDSVLDLVLLRKDVPGGKKLVEVVPAPVVPPKGITELNPDIVLEDLQTTVRCPAPRDCRLEIRLDWLSRAAGQRARAIRLDVTQDGKRVYTTEHIPGYMIYPPVLWKPQEIVREYFSVQLPLLSPGTYDLEIGLVPVMFFDKKDYPNGAPLEERMRKIGSINVN
jgi:hypothetical protein